MEHQQAAGHHEEHPPTTIRQYIMIGVILAVITVLELALTEAMDLPFRTLVAALIFLSAIKFAIVVALFMHLRFDHKLFTRLFVFGLALAAALLIALIALFGGDHQPNYVARATATPGFVAHHDEDETEGETEAPTGDPAEGMVEDMLVGEFFAANCAACHGQAREGLIGPALTPDVLTQPDSVYHETIANGRTGTAMPPWSPRLSDEEITALVQFIKHVEP